MKYDSIIIGSGIGGLTCAAFLAKRGQKVAVFEKMSQVGGYATSFIRKNIEYDVSLHAIGDLDNKGSLRKIFNELGLTEYVSFKKLNSNYSIVTEDGIVNFDGTIDFIEKLQKKFPKNEKDVENIIRKFRNLRQEIDLINFSKIPDDLNLVIPTVLKYKDHSLMEFLREETDNVHIIDEFSRYWMYFSLAPEEIAAVFYAYVWTEYFDHGAYYPEKNSQQITTGLVRIILENGGEIFKKENVNAIISENNKVVGVKTRKGSKEKMYWSTNVVGNIPPRSILKLLPENTFKQRYKNKIMKQEPSLSSFVMYIHLKDNFKEKFDQKGHEFFFSSECSNAPIEHLKNDDINQMPFSCTVYPCESDTTGSVISVFVISDYDNWINLTRKEYKIKKKEWEQILLSRIDKVFSGFSGSVDQLISGSPITNERFTSNYKGATYGSAQTVSQTLNKRLDHRTTLKGLWLCGAWTKPGAGYSGSIWSGYLASKSILEG